MSTQIAISQARSTLPSLINHIHQTLDRTLITVNGQPKVAMISIDELEALEETAEVLSIPQAKQSIAKGIKQAQKNKGITFGQLMSQIHES